MPTPDDLVRAAERAALLAAPGEQVVAVLAAAPFSGPPLYLCALGAAGAEPDDLAWVVLDEQGATVADEALVREAAGLVALCETAEEAAAAPAAEDIAVAARRALDLAAPGPPALVEALSTVALAAEAIDRLSGGLRVARSAYLDDLAAEVRALGAGLSALREQAEALSSHLQGVPGEPGEALARAVWETIGRVLQAGPPERFTDAIAGAAGAVDALAGDVVARLRHEH